MNCHGPTCLEGPVSQTRAWWHESSAAGVAVETPTQPSDKSSDGIRTDLVARVRREIAAGAYETEDKLEIALARMFHDLDQA